MRCYPSVSAGDGSVLVNKLKIFSFLRNGISINSGGQLLNSSLMSSWADRYLGQSRIRCRGSSRSPSQTSHRSSSRFPRFCRDRIQIRRARTVFAFL
jgi:hypothetical protein